MQILIFVTIALIFAVGIIFVTGKGLGFLYADKQPMTDEEVAEYTEHTNPIHMCRFIGWCLIAGAVVATMFAVGLVAACHITDIIAICLACASAITALIVYLVVFRYKPMKAKFLAAKAAEDDDEIEKEIIKPESATSQRVKAVSAVRGRR